MIDTSFLCQHIPQYALSPLYIGVSGRVYVRYMFGKHIPVANMLYINSLGRIEVYVCLKTLRTLYNKGSLFKIKDRLFCNKGSLFSNKGCLSKYKLGLSQDKMRLFKFFLEKSFVISCIFRIFAL